MKINKYLEGAIRKINFEKESRFGHQNNLNSKKKVYKLQDESMNLGDFTIVVIEDMTMTY